MGKGHGPDGERDIAPMLEGVLKLPNPGGSLSARPHFFMVGNFMDKGGKRTKTIFKDFKNFIDEI